MAAHLSVSPPAHPLGATVGASVFEPPFTREDVKSWRNIPDCVRDAFAELLEYTNKVSQTVTKLSVSVSRKANEGDIKDALSSRATTDEVLELNRFVHREIMPRMDQACPSHGSLQKLVMQQSARLSQLEAIVTTQDKMLHQMQKEIGEKYKSKDIEAAAFASKSFVEAQVATAVRGLAPISYVDSAVSGRAEYSAIELIVRDLHALNNEVSQRVTKDEVHTHVAATVASSVAAAKASTQTSVDMCLRTLSELKKSIDSKAGKDEAPGVWKAKVASLTAAFEGKINKTKDETTAEVKKLIEDQVAELVEAINKKAYKSDVVKALATKMNTADCEAALHGKIDNAGLIDALRKKVDINDLSMLKRTVVDVAQAMLSNSTGTLPGIISSLRIDGTLPLAPIQARIEPSIAQAASADVTKSIDALRAQIAEMRAILDAEMASRGSPLTSAELLELRQSVSNKAESADIRSMNSAVTSTRAKLDALQQEMAIASARLDTVERLCDMPDSASIATGRTVDDPMSLTASEPAHKKKAAVAAAHINTGRWVWKARGLDPETSNVIWDTEGMNTNASLFLWPKPETSDPEHSIASSAITLTKAGLYRIEVGFFASLPPTFTVCVNGLPAVSTLPIEGMTDETGELLDTMPESVIAGTAVLHRHPAGGVAGVCLSHVLALPSNAKLTLFYNGEIRGQGFLEIVKL